MVLCIMKAIEESIYSNGISPELMEVALQQKPFHQWIEESYVCGPENPLGTDIDTMLEYFESKDKLKEIVSQYICGEPKALHALIAAFKRELDNSTRK